MMGSSRRPSRNRRYATVLALAAATTVLLMFIRTGSWISPSTPIAALAGRKQNPGASFSSESASGSTRSSASRSDVSSDGRGGDVRTREGGVQRPPIVSSILPGNVTGRTGVARPAAQSWPSWLSDVLRYKLPSGKGYSRDDRLRNDWYGRALKASPMDVGGEAWALDVGARLAGEFIAGLKGEALRMRTVIELAERRSREGSIALVVVSEGAIGDLTVNWLAAAAFRANIVENTVLVALDSAARHFLHSIGASHLVADATEVGDSARALCSRYKSTVGRLDVNWLWVARYQVTLALLTNGINVLQMDLDAVALHDPFPAFHGIPADVVAQRGKRPVVLTRVIGSAICGGVVFFRANARVVRMLLEGLAGLAMYGDDQYALAWGILGGPQAAVAPPPVVWFLSTRWDGIAKLRPVDFEVRTSTQSKPLANDGWGPTTSTIASSFAVEVALIGSEHLEALSSLEAAHGALHSPISVAFLPLSAAPRRGCENMDAQQRSAWLVAHCFVQSPAMHEATFKADVMSSLGVWWMPRSPTPPDEWDDLPGESATADDFIAWLRRRAGTLRDEDG